MYILLFQKMTWQNSYGDDLWALPPQLFGRGGDRPHRTHAVGAYDFEAADNERL